MKTCSRCQETKPLEDFSPASRGAGSAWCRACSKAYNAERYVKRDVAAHAERTKAWREANREHLRQWHRDFHRRNPDYKRTNRILRDYGLTVERFEEMVAAQNNRCAICLQEPSGKGRNGTHLHIDHDHETGRVRGLLCGKCNTALGILAEDHERMQRMIDYIKRAT